MRRCPWNLVVVDYLMDRRVGDDFDFGDIAHCRTRQVLRERDEHFESDLHARDWRRRVTPWQWDLTLGDYCPFCWPPYSIT